MPTGGSASQVLSKVDATDYNAQWVTPTVYETAGAVATHAAAADPHTGYQKESEKAAANGYASLDASTKVPVAQLPTGASGGTVATGDHTHAPGYVGGSIHAWDADIISSGASGTVKTYTLFGAATINNFTAPRSGTLVGLMVRTNSARTGGAIKFNIRNNDTSTNLSLTVNLDGTNTLTNYASAAVSSSGNTFSAGQSLSFRAEVTSATYAPITGDVQLYAILAYDL